MEIRALHTTVGGWRWRALLVKLPVLRWSGGRGRVGAFVRHQAGGGEAVNTLSSLFTISHKFGRPVSRPQCPVSCFPFCCFINKIFGAFLPPPAAAAATDIECGDEAKLQSITWALVAAGGCWARDWNGNGL